MTYAKYHRCLAGVFALVIFTALTAPGQSSAPRRVVQAIDETKLATLKGHVIPIANAKTDRGPVEDNFAVNHIQLVLQRSPEQEEELGRLMEGQTDRTSPDFHHWLTPEEYGERFGVSQEDIEAVTGWLESHGFHINKVYTNHVMIDFSGTAGQVRDAFHTSIHNIAVKGEPHFANMSNPKIPAALATVVKGIGSLNNIRPQAMHVSAREYTFTGCAASAGVPTQTGNCYAITPQDNQTIYNLNPLYAAGISGQGQTIYLAEDTDTYGTAGSNGTSDWNTYRSTFGLSTAFPLGSYSQTHPGGCTDPGTNGDDGEAAIDVQVASAIAPSAAIQLISCPSASDTVTFGGQIAVQNLVNTTPLPAIGVISMSYGLCEAFTGQGGNAAFYNTFQQAAAEGFSVFVSSGDYGPSGCSNLFGTDYDVASLGITGWGETPFNVSVGGTDFEDTYNSMKANTAEGGSTIPLSTYWNATNTAGYGSAKSYIPEMPWNDSCANALISEIATSSFTPYGASPATCNNATFDVSTSYLFPAAGAGGASNCATGAGGTDQSSDAETLPNCQGYAKPSWQSAFGVPSDGVRDIPDVSMFAANGVWGHFETVCWSDPSQTSGGAASCSGLPSTWSGFGGTSVASPTMAAIQALVNQKTGEFWGNPNPIYYQLAQAEYGTQGGSFLGSDCNSSGAGGPASGCVFNDITQGDNDVACTYNGSLSESQCYKPSGTYGVDSTDNVTAATVITGGSGYTSAPTCAIAGPTNNQPYKSPTGSTLWAGGTQATCTATVSSSSTTAVWTIKMSDPPFTDWVSGVSGFTVGGTTYTFFTSLTGVTTPNAVLMVSSSSNSTQETDAAKNLEAAINDNSSQCVTAPCFANITAANTYAIATESTSTVTLTAKTAGYAGNFNAVWENGFLLGPELVTITNTTKGQGPNYVSGITVGTGVNAGSGYQPETPITLTGVGSGAIAIANTSISTGAQSYQPSYGAAPGYDMATGLGSPNAYNLVFASAWIKPQTITFTTNAPSSAAYNSQFTVAATASSGLTVAFTSSGSCTNSGATYTMTSGAGSCSVIANQAGDGAYAAAPTVTQTVSATPAPQTITFTTNAPSSAAYNSHFTVAATSGSGLTVAFTSSGSCTNSVATYTVTSGSGSCSVIANQSGNTNYSAAPTVTQTVNATPASQSISFTLSSTGTYGGSVPLTATATSGLPVTYHVVSGPGSITNNSPVVVEGGRPEIGCSNVVKGVRPNGVGCGYTLSFTGTGQVVVEADQTGNGNYGAATAVQQTVNVGQAPLTVNVNPASFTYGGTLPTFTGNLVTLVNGDTVGTTITVTYSTTVLANANAGTYSGAITATVTGSSAGNYVTPTVNPGTLTITPATLTATCAGGSFTQGGTVPAFAITITGIVLPVSNPGPAVVHPDRPTGITSSCGLAPGLSNESTPGNYPTGIVPTVAGIPLTNYTVVNVDGDLTINPAAPARLPGRNK